MGKEGLTAKQVEHARPGTARIEIPAGPPSGLYLVIQPTGTKSWAFRYRRFGKTCKLTFSKTYPDLKLAAARAEAQAMLDELADGKDPAAIQAEEVAISQPHSVESVGKEWLERSVEKNTRERTFDEFDRILKKDIFPAWKHKAIAEVGKPDVLRLLDSITDRDAPILANKVLAVLKIWFRWSVERGYLTASPAAEIRPPSKAKSRKRVLDRAELAEIWTAAEGLGYPMGQFMRLLLLTAQRRNEVATMRWKDVDLDHALWTLPAETTKADRIHDVPLSPTAIELLESLPRFKKGDYVFTTTNGKKPISGFSKTKVRIDTATMDARKNAGQKKNIPDWTMHDLRRSAATHMAKAGVPPHVLSAVLNHSPGSTMGVTSIYNRFRYTDERRDALQAWADFIVSLGVKTKQQAAS